MIHGLDLHNLENLELENPDSFSCVQEEHKLLIIWESASESLHVTLEQIVLLGDILLFISDFSRPCKSSLYHTFFLPFQNLQEPTRAYETIPSVKVAKLYSVSLEIKFFVTLDELYKFPHIQFLNHGK